MRTAGVVVGPVAVRRGGGGGRGTDVDVAVKFGLAISALQMETHAEISADVDSSARTKPFPTSCCRKAIY